MRVRDISTVRWVRRHKALTVILVTSGLLVSSIGATGNKKDQPKTPAIPTTVISSPTSEVTTTTNVVITTTSTPTTEARVFSGPGSYEVYADLASSTDCAYLQSKFDIAETNHRRDIARGSSLAVVSSSYMKAADERMKEIGCDNNSSTLTTDSPPRVVSPGAFCSPSGETGSTSKGTPMRCGPASDGRDRWIAA